MKDKQEDRIKNIMQELEEYGISVEEYNLFQDGGNITIFRLVKHIAEIEARLDECEDSIKQLNKYI